MAALHLVRGVLVFDELISAARGGAVGAPVPGLDHLVAQGVEVDVGDHYFVFVVSALRRVYGTADVSVLLKLLVHRET